MDSTMMNISRQISRNSQCWRRNLTPGQGFVFSWKIFRSKCFSPTFYGDLAYELSHTERHTPFTILGVDTEWHCHYGKDGQFNNTLITALNSVWTISFVLAICHILPCSTLKCLKKSFVPQKLTCKSLARLHSRCASQDEPAIDRISTFASNFPHHFVSTKCYLCHSHV